MTTTDTTSTKLIVNVTSRANDILDQIDDALADHTVSPDAMRWAPDSVPDLRLRAYREQPGEIQSRWSWWCPTCRQPLPGPRWSSVLRVPYGGAVAGQLRAYHETSTWSPGIHPVRRRTADDR